MLNLQLFIENKRVDFFEDESIQLTDSIQDARDIGKIFTAVSRDFTVPATLINNNLFKHFYNFDILDGFDPRQKVKASLFQNGFLYKKGFVQLRSVNLQNNKASSYKIFFTGLLGELKDIFKSDKLSDLLSLDKFSHPYDVTTIRAGLQNYFDVVNNQADFTNPNNKDLCYPFVSSVNRYAFGADGLRTVDENGLLTTDKIQTSDLKPALRAVRIIEAIEEKYSITFDSDFLKTDEVFTELYLWLNRSKGVLADKQTFDLSYNIPRFELGSGQAVLNLSNQFIITELSQNGTNINDFVKFNFQYDVEVIGNGGIELQIIDAVTNQAFISFSQEVEDETVSISFLFESVNFGSDLFRPLLRVITQTELITEIDIDLKVTKSERQNKVPFTQIGNYSLTGGSVVAISEVNVSLQIPSMLILDFLNSIFKTFNLTALVQNNGSIKVQPLDEFYAEGKVMDITNQIDISKSQVKRFEPYREINFDFEKANSFLMVSREKILDDIFGNLNFQVGSDDPSKVISGGAYNVKPKFHKILPERLRIEDGSLSPIMYSWYVNEESEPLSNQPILFYTKRQEFTGSTAIQFQNGENLESNIAPSNVKQDLGQTINFGAEIDEYTLEVNNNSLFNNLYRKFILGAFSPRSKILKVKAYLNADFILNYELNGTFIINGRKFNINTLDVNLGTGEANLELRNIFNISAIPNPDNPTVDQLTISSPSQSENDASGSYTFDVISNVSWTVSESSDFISVSPVSGSNNETLTITYDENTTTDTRAGVITVTGGGFVREHTLTQAGKEVQLTISSSSNTVTKEAGDYTIQIISNTDWVVTDDKSWISESPTNGFGDATLTISRSENLSTNIRQAIIEVQAGSVVRTHTLTQQAQSSTQLYPHDLKQGDTASIACARTSTQTYYTDESFYDNSNLIFFDSNGNNKVPSGFFAKGIRVLETNNNGQVIDSGRC
jgi:hypothetical protein